jgi:hypothetical protein
MLTNEMLSEATGVSVVLKSSIPENIIHEPARQYCLTSRKVSV